MYLFCYALHLAGDCLICTLLRRLQGIVLRTAQYFETVDTVTILHSICQITSRLEFQLPNFYSVNSKI